MGSNKIMEVGPKWGVGHGLWSKESPGAERMEDIGWTVYMDGKIIKA